MFYQTLCWNDYLKFIYTPTGIQNNKYGTSSAKPWSTDIVKTKIYWFINENTWLKCAGNTCTISDRLHQFAQSVNKTTKSVNKLYWKNKVCNSLQVELEIDEFYHLTVDYDVNLMTISERMTSRKSEKKSSWPEEWNKKWKQKGIKDVNIMIMIELVSNENCMQACKKAKRNREI